MTKWIEALKVYNQDKDKWTIPRKGTAEYKKVRKIMDSMPSSKTTQKKQEGKNLLGLTQDLFSIIKTNPLVKKFVKETAPVMKKIAQEKLSTANNIVKEKKIDKLVEKLSSVANKKVYKPVNKLLQQKVGITGSGHSNQRGGFLATLAVIVAPFVIEGIINTAKGKKFFGDGIMRIGMGNNDMEDTKQVLAEMYQEELSGSGLFEDLAFAFNPSANVARLQLNKELKQMKGGDLFEDIAYAFNPSANVARLQLNKELKKMKGGNLSDSLASLNRAYKAKYGETLVQAADREQRERRKKMKGDGLGEYLNSLRGKKVEHWFDKESLDPYF